MEINILYYLRETISDKSTTPKKPTSEADKKPGRALDAKGNLLFTYFHAKFFCAVKM